MNIFNLFNKGEVNLEGSWDLKTWYGSQNFRVLKTLWISVEDAINDRVSNSIDRKKLVKDLKNMSGKDLEACKSRAENLLKEDVVELVFWDYIEKTKARDFSWNDIDWYRNYYLYETDFWNKLANRWIFFQKIWGDGFDKKILLSLQQRISRWKNEVHVNIPFRQQYQNRSGLYKVDIDEVDIKYKWGDKIERIVNLINFVQEVQRIDKSGDRKLWVFGDK